VFGVVLIKPTRYAVFENWVFILHKKNKELVLWEPNIVSCYFVCLWFLGYIIYALKVVVGKSDDCISDRSYGFYR
jgi:hypothetical protein